MKLKILSALAAASLQVVAFAVALPMRYLYRADEKIVSAHSCEVIRHPYIAGMRDQEECVVVRAKAREAFGPLAPGSYLIRACQTNRNTNGDWEKS